MTSKLMNYLLGGTSIPMAGDGLGLAVPCRPTPSSKSTTPTQSGIRAPRCSLTSATTLSTRPSKDSFQTAASTMEDSPRKEIPDIMGETWWEDYEIPQELEVVRGDTPKEIRDIIQESLDEHRAMRASRLQTQAIVVRTTIESSRTLRQKDRP